MSPWIGLILGLVQGLTEFLPVSSSGHLVLTQRLLGLKEPLVGFDIILHLATLFAATIALRRELARILGYLLSLIGIRWVSMRSDQIREGQRLFWALVIGTIPAAVVGLLFKERIEKLFEDPIFVGYALIFTGAVLLSTRLAPKGTSTVGVAPALAIGLAQAVALVPGISRSGLTVASGLWMGLKREQVVRFSFLLSLPAILGAFILEARHGLDLAGIPVVTLLVAFLAALVSGYVAMLLLLRVVISGRLSLFGLYCVAAGIGALFLFSHR